MKWSTGLTPAGSNDSSSISAAFAQVIFNLIVEAADEPAETVTEVSCNPNPVPVNSPTTCTAVVTGDSPTGDVNFSSDGSGAFSANSCTLAAGTCSVDYTPSSGSASPPDHTVTAAYEGDDANEASEDTFELTVTRRTTSTALSCVPASVVIGDDSTCTATVSDTEATGIAITPTGSVDFSNSGGTFSASNCALSSGSCSVTYTPTSVGSHTITAEYDGDVDHLASENTDTVDAIYAVCALYDEYKSHKAGSTVPIKVQLCDADGNNLSSSSVTAQAVTLTKKDNSASAVVEDSGSANSPDNNFRYSADLEGYIFNLSTKQPTVGQKSALSSGSWSLCFTASTTGTQKYCVGFDVK